ncbi:uncharacterized protein VP01_2432g3 [Puccinia sorghi]|uniref:Uncharacterized protein n=1 Tax=Puccinia sorghi TaxID=27349 RepID=A0A0L6V6E2_9BASI|nr:uncharacterized protein VP01_2432g3 [Puccinia sorghi]
MYLLEGPVSEWLYFEVGDGNNHERGWNTPCPPPWPSWLNPTHPASRTTAELVPAQTLWSTSAHVSARTAKQTPAKSVEELVLALYHQYLHMFHKSS